MADKDKPCQCLTSAHYCDSKDAGYGKPPGKIADILNAAQPQVPVVSPDSASILLATPRTFLPVVELAEPMLRLAGVRIVAASRRLQNARYYCAYDMVDVCKATCRHLLLPDGVRAGLPQWSADSRHFAFPVAVADRVELWVGDRDSLRVRRISGIRLNPMLGYALRWLDDCKSLLVKVVPDGDAPPPPAPPVAGPEVLDTAGARPSGTYESRDLLSSSHDEDMFACYGRSQLLRVDITTGVTAAIGRPGVYAEVRPSPDNRHILVSEIVRPYSRLTTHARFPRRVEIWSIGGAPEHRLASLPQAIAPVWGVRTGPRGFAWIPREPATICWIEALDGGDWKVPVEHRDRVLTLKAPFSGTPEELVRLCDRFAGFWWGKGDISFVREINPMEHRKRILAMDFSSRHPIMRIVREMNSDDRYADPGRPVMEKGPGGYCLMLERDSAVFFAGEGASPDGDRAFLDRMDLSTFKTERLFHSAKNSCESFVAWLSYGDGTFITRHETPSAFPNFFVKRLRGKSAPVTLDDTCRPLGRRLTCFRNPYSCLRGITGKHVTYKRADGVELSFTLYLPPGYRGESKLPAIFWAYPMDYTDAAIAGQRRGLSGRFPMIPGVSPLFFLLNGYAVLDHPRLPIIGLQSAMYDDYVNQLVAGAEAAIRKADELGVIDTGRIAVGGHSHGALMAANLLAYSRLFRAGIGCSGGYNKTLVPFGFQNEVRSLWEAPAVYDGVSALHHADRIKAPFLLIHGNADNNPGTIPLQSIKMFEAIRGNGGTARLVLLPYESHEYVARESIEHVICEMFAWCDTHVKNDQKRESWPVRITSRRCGK